MKDPYFKKVTAMVLVFALLIISFLILRTILLSIIFGFIIAFIFSPVYKLLFKITKWPNFSAAILTIILILIILLPIWFFTPTLIDQGFKIYSSIQEADYITPLKGLFPSLFASDQFSREVAAAAHSFVTKTVNSLLSYLSDFILNFPTFLLQATVVLFTFFFALRDRQKITEYIRSLFPFSKEVEDKIFKSSKDVTASVLYGQIVIGVIQGIIIAAGFFIFGVPNALLYSVLAVIIGVLPIVGTALVWIPVVAYLLLVGESFMAMGVLVFGLISSNIDNIIRPLFISKLTKLPSAIILIGMIGGFFFFGVLGLILGPLVLSYVLIIFEILRDKHPSKGFQLLLKKS